MDAQASVAVPRRGTGLNRTGAETVAHRVQARAQALAVDARTELDYESLGPVCRASDFWQGPLLAGLSLIVVARPPVLPAEEKVRIVLSILAGELSVAEAARRAKVSEQSVGTWKRQFLEGGRAGLSAATSRSSSREQQLEAEVADLTQALGEAAVEIQVWKKSAEGRLGPSRTSR